MEDRISRRRFIHLGAALGVSAAGASVLAACGGGASGGASGAGGGESGTGGSGGGGEYGGGAGGGGEAKQSSGKKTDGGTQRQPSGGQAIARTSEVAPGSAINFKDSGSPAVLIHLESGDFVAYSAVCTHQQCTVAYSNGQLACPCHGSVFDPANNGQIVSPPASRPLPQIPVEVRGGEVFKA